MSKRQKEILKIVERKDYIGGASMNDIYYRVDTVVRPYATLKLMERKGLVIKSGGNRYERRPHPQGGMKSVYVSEPVNYEITKLGREALNDQVQG